MCIRDSFEPVHGSTPKRAGKGEVNPIAMLSSVQLLLEWLGRRRNDADASVAAEIIESSIEELIGIGKPLTYDLGGSASTSEVSSALCEMVAQRLRLHYNTA